MTTAGDYCMTADKQVHGPQGLQGVGSRPYSHSSVRMSSSKIGSKTSLTAICTSRSRIVGIPSGRFIPSGFGMETCRLQRHSESLRHPIRPGLSLVGVRSKVVNICHIGLPVLRSSSVPTCRRPYPGGPYRLSLVLPGSCRLPQNSAASASASPFSRPAEHSLTLRPTCSPTR